MNSQLKQISNRPVRCKPGSIDAYIVVRDEADRLPFLLEHHRQLGVDRFFVCDNDSQDGSLQFLLAQDDCIVYQTLDSFGEAGCGMNWINAMIARHGEGNWCLFLDADELFIYPYCEQIGIKDFCRFLDQAGHDAVFAIMVDMYAAGPVAEAVNVKGKPFYETCPYFDRDYQVRRKAALPFSKRFLDVEAIGGPRLRVFYPRYHNMNIWQMALARAVRSVRHHRLGRMLGLHRTDFGSLPPDITKVPLMRCRNGERWATNHRTVPLPVADVTGALLHFKLFANFDQRARSEAARGEHWGSGVEYRRYVSQVEAHPKEGFMYENSVRYRSSEDLRVHGIIRSCPPFDAVLEEVAASRAQGRAVAS